MGQGGGGQGCGEGGRDRARRDELRDIRAAGACYAVHCVLHYALQHAHVHVHVAMLCHALGYFRHGDGACHVLCHVTFHSAFHSPPPHRKEPTSKHPPPSGAARAISPRAAVAEPRTEARPDTYTHTLHVHVHVTCACNMCMQHVHVHVHVACACNMYVHAHALGRYFAGKWGVLYACLLWRLAWIAACHPPLRHDPSNEDGALCAAPCHAYVWLYLPWLYLPWFHSPWLRLQRAAFAMSRPGMTR